MGARGPGKMPIKLAILHGHAEARINRNAPEPKAGLPVKPRGMSTAARAVWNRQVRLYGATGVLTGIDADVFRVYCEAVVRYEHSAQLLEQSGPLVKSRDGGLVKNPLNQIVRDSAELVRAFGRELGFTPSARSSITGLKQAGPEDPLEKWMKS